MISIYGSRRARDFPLFRVPGCGSAYAYVCVFPSIAKVGVTTFPHGRSGQLQAVVGEAALQVHFILLPERTARGIENLIAHTFGGPTQTKGRPSEWFDTNHADAAIAMLGDPALHATAKGWRVRKRIIPHTSPAHLTHGKAV